MILLYAVLGHTKWLIITGNSALRPLLFPFPPCPTDFSGRYVFGS